jgi:serine O-acetyltransferase
MSFRAIRAYFFGGTAQKIKFQLRIASKLYNCGYPRLAKYMHRSMQRYGVHISEKACIPFSVRLPHPVGIVIGEGVVIGENVTIFQNVTIGGARLGDAQKDKYPQVGSNVVIFAGAVLVGDIKVGRNCTIGANAVVIHDVPDNCICVGVPGRNLHKLY